MKTIHYMILCIVALFFGCIEEYNPFLPEHSCVTINRITSFNSSDSIRIFCTETLWVSAYVVEYIDSFSIHIEHNRLWYDTTIYHNDIYSTIPFYFSIIDTGSKKITIKTYKNNNTTPFITTYTLFTYSPLYQEHIEADLGDDIVIKTDSVRDKDLLYYWYFPPHDTIVRYTYEAVCCPQHGTTDTLVTGQLWIQDTSGNHSPHSLFTFYLADKTGPQILYIHEDLVHGDTIAVGDSSFFFRVFILDNNNSAPATALIDGNTFDEKDTVAHIYTHFIDSIYGFSQDNPRCIRVGATDNSKNHNTTRRNFYVYYDEAIQNTQSVFVQIEKIQDSLTAKPYLSICGKTRSNKQQSLRMKIVVNGSCKNNDTVITLQKDADSHGWKGTWSWNSVPLATNDRNVITVQAFAESQTVPCALDSTVIHHFFSIVDSIPPTIAAVTVDSTQIDITKPFYTSKERVTVSVRVKEFQSQIENVIINDTNAVNSDSTVPVWSAPVLLHHLQSGNSIAVKVTDKANNTTNTLLTLFHNTMPVVQNLKWNSTVFIDTNHVTPFVDTLVLFDADSGDRITLRDCSDVTVAMDLDTMHGIVTWYPHIGSDTIRIGISDGIQDTVYAWPFCVKTKTVPVLSFGACTLPDTIQIHAPALHEVLKIKKGTGIGPFSFSAWIPTSDDTLLFKTSDSTIYWNPVESDTGMHYFIAVVTDAYPHCDTLRDTFAVIPPHFYPCSLSTSNHPLLQHDTLDLSNSDTATLTFTIHDKDPFHTEEYILTIVLGNKSETYIPKDSIYTRTFLPVKENISEQCTVTVTDKNNSSDTVSITIKYPVRKNSLHAVTITPKQ